MNITEVSVPNHKYLGAMATFSEVTKGEKVFYSIFAHFLKVWDCFKLKKKSLEMFLNRKRSLKRCVNINFKS